MKKLLLASVLAMTAAATSASAGTISFFDIAGGAGFTDSTNTARTGGEADWNFRVGAGVGILDTSTGISVVGSALLSEPGSATAYFDNGAGLGVCSVVTNLGQCNPSNDDNVGAIGGSNNAGDGTSETLVLSFSSLINLTDILFRAEGHGLFNGSLTINGVITNIVNGAWNAGLTGSVFNFGYIPVASNQGATNEFYIDSVGVAAVPVPAAGMLLLGGLGMLGFGARRRKQRAA